MKWTVLAFDVGEALSTVLVIARSATVWVSVQETDAVPHPRRCWRTSTILLAVTVRTYVPLVIVNGVRPEIW